MGRVYDVLRGAQRFRIIWHGEFVDEGRVLRNQGGAERQERGVEHADDAELRLSQQVEIWSAQP